MSRDVACYLMISQMWMAVWVVTGTKPAFFVSIFFLAAVAIFAIGYIFNGSKEKETTDQTTSSKSHGR